MFHILTDWSFFWLDQRATCAAHQNSFEFLSCWQREVQAGCRDRLAIFVLHMHLVLWWVHLPHFIRNSASLISFIISPLWLAFHCTVREDAYFHSPINLTHVQKLGNRWKGSDLSSRFWHTEVRKERRSRNCGRNFVSSNIHKFQAEALIVVLCSSLFSKSSPHVALKESWSSRLWLKWYQQSRLALSLTSFEGC